ncbi:MAG: glycosyltransferase [Clostridia bacterium]|nr:glycosyltransferase [Clostridia bacterium]
MIICVVCDVLGAENNGTTIAAMNLIRSLRAKGHTVRVVCPDEDKKGQPDYYVVKTLNFGPFNSYVKKNGVTIAKPDKKVLTAALSGADHVHLMIPFALGTKALRMAKDAHISVTAGFHCQAENITSHLFLKNNRFINKFVYRFFYRKFYRYVDGVHYPTEFIRGVFEKYGGKTVAYVISNGVSREFHPEEVERDPRFEGKQVVLFTGRYSKEKSHRVLIDAVALSRHADTIQLVFAGDGPLKEKLQKRSRKLKNPPIFNFFSRRDMVRILNTADLYVHPAEIEIEAISCLEAISCGLVPVISDSPRSATRYFALDQNNLFECNNSRALAEKIDYWLDHPAEKAARSEEYLGYTGQFDFDTCMDRMEKMIIAVHKQTKETVNNG